MHSLVLPLLTGIALGLSFPPYPLSVLAWVALVPLLLRWTDRTSAGWMLAEAYLSFGVACAVAFYWVLLHEMSEAALASLGGLLLFPLFMALPFAASLPLRRRWGSAAGFAALMAFYLVMEWGLSHGPLAFPWPLLGHTQATLDPFRQMADLAGVPGLTAWLLGLNGLALAIVRSPHRLWKGLAALAFLLLIASAYAYGTRQLEAPARDTSAETQALLVQPALPPSDWSDVTSTTRVDTLLQLSAAALDTTAEPIDLVIWPETALPAFQDTTLQQDLYASLQRWAAQHDITLLTGAVEPAPTPDTERGVFFNSAFLVRPDTLYRYRKHYLVPFAEHVPFSEYLPRLQALNVPSGGVAGYRRGTRQAPLQDADFHAGALICFESTFSHYVRAYVAPNDNAPPADFLVTLAQDGWWGRSPGHRQHLAFSQLRAIETRRAMAFVTVTGTTALINPRGQATTSIGWMEQDARRVTIPHATRRSPYVDYGDWLSPMALAFSIGFVLAGLIHSYVRRRERPDLKRYYAP